MLFYLFFFLTWAVKEFNIKKFIEDKYGISIEKQDLIRQKIEDCIINNLEINDSVFEEFNLTMNEWYDIKETARKAVEEKTQKAVEENTKKLEYA